MKITPAFTDHHQVEKFVFLLQGLHKEKTIMAFKSRAVLLRYLESRGGLIYIHKSKRPQQLTNYLKLAREINRFPVMHITLVPPGATLISHNESFMIYKLPLIKQL